MNTSAMNAEVDGLVKKYTAGSKYAQKQSLNNRVTEKGQNALIAEELRLQKELALAKQDIDEINKEVEENLKQNQMNTRAKSNQDSARPVRQPNYDQ